LAVCVAVVSDGVGVVAVRVGDVMVAICLFCVEQRVIIRPKLKHTATFYRWRGGGIVKFVQQILDFAKSITNFLKFREISVMNEFRTSSPNFPMSFGKFQEILMKCRAISRNSNKKREIS